MSVDFTPNLGTYRDLSPFRYWCQKVMPLIYDDSLSYYELLCKVVDYLNKTMEDTNTLYKDVTGLYEAYVKLQKYVNDYFNNLDIQKEVDEYFDELISSGDIIQVLRTALKSNLVSYSFWRPFAQVLPTENRIFNSGSSQQGFAIGEINSRPVCCNCFTDGTASGVADIVKFTYLDTGVEIGSYTVQAGHCNSATFNGENFVIACGGGNSTSHDVIEINVNGNVIGRHSFSELPWGISYEDEKYYILMSGNTMLECDKDFNVLETHNMTYNDKYTYQGVFSDELYLYLPCGNTRTLTGEYNRNFIEVRYHDGTLFTTIESYFPQEIEECAIYNGECYLASNTQDCCMLVVCDLYTNKISGYYGYWNVTHSNTVRLKVYYDETYNGFFMDGKQNTPFSSLLWFSFLVPPNITYVDLYLLSDCETHPLTTVSPTSYNLHIYGNGHRILRINYASLNTITVTNLSVKGQNGLTCVFVTSARCILENVTIGDGTTTSKRGLEIHGPYEILGITFESDIEDDGYLVYLMGDGYFKQVTVNTDVIMSVMMCGVCTVDATFPLSKVNKCNIQRVTYKLNFTLLGELDVTDLYFPCVLNINSSATLTNLPEGFTSSNTSCLICEYVNENKSLVTLVKNDGTTATIYNHR